MTIYDLLTERINNKREISNFLLFSAGKLISIFGSSIYTFALGLYVLKLTGSGLSFAVTLVLGTIPMIIVNPIAGVAADRLDKKALIISMDLLNGILLLVVYFLSSAHGLSIALVYITTLALTVFTTFFGVAVEAAKPNIVTRNMLLNINSISKIIDSISSILGPMIGGMIFAFIDVRLFIAINGISFILSAVCEMFIDFKLNCEDTAGDKIKVKLNLYKDIKDGFKYLVERKEIKMLFMILIILNFSLGFSITVPLPFILNHILKLGSKEFGFVQAAFPAGMIIGALFAGRVGKNVAYAKLSRILNFVLSLCMLISVIPVLPFGFKLGSMGCLLYYSGVMTAFGIAISLIDIPLAYVMQRIIPDEYRGRVLSIGISIAKTMLPVALVISGSLLNLVPAYIMPIAGGILLLLFSISTSRGSGHKTNWSDINPEDSDVMSDASIIT